MYRNPTGNKIKMRKRIKLLILLSLIAVFLAAFYYFLTTHTVKNVYVEGNVHYTKEEIEDMVMEGPLATNSVYLSLKYKNKAITDIPFIASMNVEVVSPDTIRIKVYEKALAGYVEDLDHYIYFDKDGTVVEISAVKTAGIPQITGLSFDYIVLNEKLPVKDEAIFYKILTVTKTLEKCKLSADRIHFDGKMNMTLYFGGIKVAFGSDELLNEKIVRLQKLLPLREGESGTFDLRNYDESTKYIPFTPDK